MTQNTLFSDQNIGFIGFGKMAQAIYHGALNSGLITKEHTQLCEKNTEITDAFLDSDALASKTLKDIASSCKVLLICVKPQNITDVLSELKKSISEETLVLSILAGIGTKTFESELGPTIQCIRIMPNTPALLQKSMSALYFNNNVTEENKEKTITLFNALGEVVTIEDESHMDIVTGISGSGPAFIYRLANDIANLGNKEGLDKEAAIKLISQTFIGAGHMLLQSGKTPEQLITDVSSPNGTTVAGLKAFDDSHIDHEIQNVILTAINRSRELSKES